MIWCEPSYIKEFHCIADKCSDTCCAGWEIVLDEDALERYEQTEGSFCYVGQAVNIADRWKQHIKRGIGADTPTRNKLYPAMLENGVENFSFEVIEECPREKLSEREDYWQDFFKAKEFGYSIK